jgi:hypothetical protein
MNWKYCLMFFFPAFMKSSWCNAQKIKNAVITIHSGHPVNSFIASECLGAAYDGHPKGETNLILKPENVRSMASAGLNEISYRLRTELGGEAWHWNPHGRWSEQGKRQGYWISDSIFSEPIQLSYGYRLPRRGNTHDQANDDDYSRIADGNNTSYWKSNPYLSEHFTGSNDSLHPQWVVIDLGKMKKVNYLKIYWTDPYAVTFKLDYALDIGTDYFDPYQPGLWHSFPQRSVLKSSGGDQLVALSGRHIRLRFVRITLLQSSHTASKLSKDIRDSLGYAIRELELGLYEQKVFHDHIIHKTNNKIQTVIHVSSTDPWHRAADIDSNTEQTGIDRFFQCGLTKGLPTMLPIGLLYDTPENMKAFIRYIKQRHYPVEELELGEEPEGQLIHPGDYASLYMQWADSIRTVLPTIKMGGPGFAALAYEDDEVDSNSFTEATWTRIFLEELRKSNHLNSFDFFSTEWYPFDNICAPPAPQLTIAPQMLSNALKNIRKVLPKQIPLYLTEYGYSAYGGKAEVEIEGGLMYADILGQFLRLGGRKSYLYGYEPTYLERKNNCSYGNNMLFGLDDKGNIIYRTAAYYTMKMMAQYWAQPSDSVLQVYQATSSVVNKNKEEIISTYVLLRPDKKWSLAIINKDPVHSYRTIIKIDPEDQKPCTDLLLPAECIQYSKKEYKWKENGAEGHPIRSQPPVRIRTRSAKSVILPPYSLTIVSQ